MLQSDVLNAPKTSPGVIATMTGPGTTTYTATQNLTINLIGQVGSSGSLLLNGVVVFSFQQSTVLASFSINVYLASGQSLTIAPTGTSTQVLATARSIQ